MVFFFFFSSRRRHTRWTGDWSSDVCSSDLQSQMISIAMKKRGFKLLGPRLAMPGCRQWHHFWGPSAGLMRDQRERRALDHRSEERRVGKECRFGWVRWG